MSNRRTQATIPEPAEDVRSLRTVAMATKELVETLAGQRGPRADQAVLWGELPPPPLPPDADIAWNPLPYINGWADYGDAAYGLAGFRKLSSGLVIMRGLVAHATTPPPAGICTLPVGYRPSIMSLTVAYHSSGVCRMDLSYGGLVSHSAGSAGWISLNNICFLAEN